MATYKAPVEDMMFLLNEVFQADQIWQSMPGTSEVSSDLAKAILTEGAKICETLLYPLNRSGDEEACQFDGENVTTPPGFKAAYAQFAQGGWVGLGGEPDYSGQGMPKMLTVLFEEMMFAANASFALYPGLTAGAALALVLHGTDAMKKTYLHKMYDGTWSGTMCLTEPHCGSDLGILRTKATPNSDGSYALKGTKIFITGGDHDLTENIVHFVLAKLPDAPKGSKGISLFLVPKILVNEDGSLGEANDVRCGSIEHKMGIQGSATCVLNFDEAKGWLVGEVNKGLAAMFVMMNYERLSISLQGQGAMEMAYQHAVLYAKERLQGRSPLGVQSPDQEADALLVHPDVRRMLLTIKAYNEGCRAFAMYAGLQLDRAKYHPEPAVRERAEQLVALVTPIAKAYLTDRGFECAVLAQQVFGGHGYIREWGVEQLVRDSRIAQIYEGTNGIQAMDLLGRKIFGSNGQILAPLMADIAETVDAARQHALLMAMADAVADTASALQNVTSDVLHRAQNNPAEIGAAAVEYLELAGLAVLAMMWLKMATVAADRLAQGTNELATAKLAVACFFSERLLPRAMSLAKNISAGSATLMAPDVVLFR
ncbi:MAG: acyl-CoA dehydrogenase C-terminal domain-containing protein [Gammaproteobacteria bacterium]